jgi:hypothetical protein
VAEPSKIETNVQRGCLGLVLAFVVLIVGGFLYNELTGVEPEPRDQSALACDHFRNVMGDVDVLTAAELRAKLAEVEGNAAIARPSVQAASRSLLAAVTTGTPDDAMTAAAEMYAACR